MTMFQEIWTLLARWHALDTWIVITGALAAMACTLPGCFLVLRGQSMMGDALSHTTLLGIVSAFVAAHALRQSGWLSEDSYVLARHAMMFGGAVLIGILSALLTEWIQKLGRVEASAALGVVFTIFFALGLLLMRVAADNVDVDPDCVLYGTVETAYVGVGVPIAAVVNGGMLLANLLLVALFFKELRICAFDPAMANCQGIPARAMHYALMAVTAATVVAAFESVGAILVIAMLITPAATGFLLTQRLAPMIVVSLAVAASAALLGHAMAITLPAVIFSRLGFDSVRDASSAGMMAVACGLLFAGAIVFSPGQGILSRAMARFGWQWRVLSEDLLGLLYRLEERQLEHHAQKARRVLAQAMGVSNLSSWLAVRRLLWLGEVAATDSGYRLTDAGRRKAAAIVRSHRLWESYVAKHFPLPADHLHGTAARAEHFIDGRLREELAGELSTPLHDPHGKEIPPEDRQAETENE